MLFLYKINYWGDQKRFSTDILSKRLKVCNMFYNSGVQVGDTLDLPSIITVVFLHGEYKV
jgi:hypothetical protein